MFRSFRVLLGVFISVVLILGIVRPACAFVHPGVGLTLADLNYVKTNLNTAPWSVGYAALAADGHSSTNYTMQGPFTYVNRNNAGNYDHQGAWISDMQAVYNLARMWYFTGDTNYAKKSHDILIAWATTQTNYGGIEASFDLGGYAYRYAGGADILRGTWPGWTAADTATVSNYFNNVFWVDLGFPAPMASGSQGMEPLTAAVAIAIFNDDTNKFNQVLTNILTDADSGFRDTHPNGEMGDTGRDPGHAGLYLDLFAWIAEDFWKQGVDIFSVYDQRIHACAEYNCRFNLGQTELPFVPLGAPFMGVFNQIAGTPWGGLYGTARNILHVAYAERLGIQTPYIDLFGLSWDADSFVNYRLVDTSTATPPVVANLPATASVSSGLTSADLNGATPAGSTTYSGGTWTLRSGYSGVDPWNASAGNDTVRFVYKQVTGDFVMIAKVASVSNVGSTSAKAGIMLRDSLTTAANRAWVAITPGTTYERAVRGWTALPYGANAQSMGSSILQIPYWVKMERVGNRIQTFTSINGGDWSPAVTADFAGMPSTVYVGLFGASFVSGTLNTATFTDVRLTGGNGGEALKTPPAPFAVYASPGAGQVPLHWNESFTATNYNVLRSMTNGGPYTSIASVTNTSYVDTDVAPNTTYYYVVTASNNAGTSTNSLQDSTTTQPTPSAPTGLNTFPGNTQATSVWIPSSTATSYNVKRSTTSGSGYVTVTNVTGNSFVDTGLANGTTYYYVVSSVNDSGEGPNSTEVSVTPGASATALIWSGAVNGTWDTTTANWLNGGASATFANGNTAIFDDSASANTSVTLSANRSPGVLVFNNALKDYTLGGSAVAGTTSLIKQGGGALTLSGANSYTGGTKHNNGTMWLGNGGALGSGTLTLNGGAVVNTGSADITVGNNIVVGSGGGAITLGTGKNFSLTGSLSGSGNLTLGGPNPLSSLNLYFSANTLSGTITIPDSTANNQTVVRFKTVGSGSATAAWSIGGAQDRHNTLDFGAGTIAFGSLSGSGIIGGNSAGLKTLVVGALGTSTTFSGQIRDIALFGSGTVALTKVGAGTLTLSDANAYTGGTVVSAGTLAISTVSAAAGNYSVANGATLAVTNASSGSAVANNLSLAAGSTMEFQNVAGTTTPLIAAGGVTVNGGCTVRITGTSGLVVGNAYPLVSYSGAFSGNFTALQLQMPSGWNGVLVSNANQIQLSVVAVPVVPSGLAAAPGDAQVSLSWSPSANATGYNVKRSTVSGGPYDMIATVATPACLDASVSNGTRYYYVVSAVYAGGETTTSAELSVLPVSLAPTSLASSRNGNQLQLSWPTDHTGWHLETQTNSLNAGLGTNWFSVAGSALTNRAFISIDTAAGSVFLRLVYP